ncbi:MAG: DinB family protein [Chitinophagales bacterium]
MSRSNIIASRLREVLLDGHWIANTNCKEQIQSLDWQGAIRKVGNVNTIADLTFHLNYYLEGLLAALDTGTLEISDKFSFDSPEVKSQKDWTNLVETFLNNSEKYIERIKQIPDNQLDQPFIGQKYGTFGRNIDGVIEHSYYHLGQISLIRKLIT